MRLTLAATLALALRSLQNENKPQITKEIEGTAALISPEKTAEIMFNSTATRAQDGALPRAADHAEPAEPAAGTRGGEDLAWGHYASSVDLMSRLILSASAGTTATAPRLGRCPGCESEPSGR